MKMRLLYPEANHIICAYRIPGLERFYCEDYCDDGEISGGAELLRWMTEMI